MWLDNMQHLYNGLCVIDPHALLNYNFALLLIGNLPETAEWCAHAVGLRQHINYFTANIDTTPITLNDFVTDINNKYYFCNKNNFDVQAEVLLLTTRLITIKARSDFIHQIIPLPALLNVSTCRRSSKKT